MFEIGIDHAPGRLIEDAFFEQRIGEAHQNAAVDLAFDLPRIHRPAAILDGDHALDAHDAGLGVDRDFGELHAAQILLRQRGIVAMRAAKAAVIVAAAKRPR